MRYTRAMDFAMTVITTVDVIGMMETAVPEAKELISSVFV